MPQVKASAVAFAGRNEDTDILERREITGRLPEIIDDARIFLKRNIRAPARECGFRREFELIGEELRVRIWARSENFPT